MNTYLIIMIIVIILCSIGLSIFLIINYKKNQTIISDNKEFTILRQEVFGTGNTLVSRSGVNDPRASLKLSSHGFEIYDINNKLTPITFPIDGVAFMQLTSDGYLIFSDNKNYILYKSPKSFGTNPNMTISDDGNVIITSDTGISWKSNDTTTPFTTTPFTTPLI